MSETAPVTEIVPSSFRSKFRRGCGRFLLQAGVWFALSLAVAGMLVVGRPFNFWEALQFSLANWMPWALVTPLVFWLAGRFPIGRGKLVRHAGLHLGAGCLCTVLVAAISLQMPAGGRFVVTAGAAGGPRLVGPAGPGGPEPRLVRPGPGEDGRSERILGGPGMPNRPMRTIGGGPGGALPPPGDATAFPPLVGTLRSEGGVEVVGRGVGGPGRPDAEARWRLWLMLLFTRANAGIAVYLVIATAAHALGYFRQAQERERQAMALEASRNQAKLDALRLQLHPHFLFNTLNAISTLVHRDPDAADNLIGDLSELLRVSLQSAEHEVPLARELVLLDHYLAIEQARLGERLKVRREIDPAALGVMVPTLILQPLAENAVRHGIEPRLGPGVLTIEARREGDRLHIVVADNGAGLRPNAATAGEGVGLRNGAERLRTLHGNAARLEVKEAAGGGVRVEIELPCRERVAAEKREPALTAARA